MEDIYEYTDKELNQLGNAIVWTALLAAIHNDGVIYPTEKAEAIKQTHIRTFSTEDYLKPIYKHLDAHFEADFDAFSKQLTGTSEEQEQYVQQKIEESLAILPEIGPLFTEKFSKGLADFYNRVFRADSSILQVFLLPVLTAHLNKFGKRS